MRIYVSGSFNEQTRLRDESVKLRQLGYDVTSTWLNEATQPEHLTEAEWYRSLATKDLVDLTHSDCIVMDTDGGSTTGGKYVEWGFALGRFELLKILVGSQNNGIFQSLSDYKFENWQDLLSFFKKRKGK